MSNSLEHLTAIIFGASGPPYWQPWYRTKGFRPQGFNNNKIQCISI